jgi:hypothetical protein
MGTLEETERLRELHDDYVWELNAAVAEGREDLICALVDDYLAASMHEMSGARCGSDGIAIARPSAPSPQRRPTLPGWPGWVKTALRRWR